MIFSLFMHDNSDSSLSPKQMFLPACCITLECVGVSIFLGVNSITFVTFTLFFRDILEI